MTATRWTVSRASAGCRPHRASVLAMLVVSTARGASEMGSSFSHFPNERTAKVLGMLSTTFEFVVVGVVSKLAGSNAGGAGVLELFMRARWMGVVSGLELDCPRLGGCGALCDVFTSTLAKFSQLVLELGDLMLGVWIRGPGW